MALRGRCCRAGGDEPSRAVWKERAISLPAARPVTVGGAAQPLDGRWGTERRALVGELGYLVRLLKEIRPSVAESLRGVVPRGPLKLERAISGGRMTVVQ
jgi:hypothetical protein